jgi:hypothetical protein
MTLKQGDRANLRRLLRRKLPDGDEAAEAFFRRLDDAVHAYRVQANYLASGPEAQRDSKRKWRHVVKHTDALLRLLDSKDTFYFLIGVEMSPPRFQRVGAPSSRPLGVDAKMRDAGALALHAHHGLRVRKELVNDLRQCLRSLHVAAKRAAERKGGIGENRGPGRPRGLSEFQARLAVECCEALQVINVTPRLTISKRNGKTGGNDGEFPRLLRWALAKAERRTKDGTRLLVGDVAGIAKEGLKAFRARW